MPCAKHPPPDEPDSHDSQPDAMTPHGPQVEPQSTNRAASYAPKPTALISTSARPRTTFRISCDLTILLIRPPILDCCLRCCPPFADVREQRVDLLAERARRA